VSRAVLRAAAAGILGAFAGAAWLVLLYSGSPALRLDFEVTPPATIVQGVYPAERDPTNGITFAWTSETMTIELAELDRQVPWNMDVRVRGARAAGLPNPELTFAVDGLPVSIRPTTTDYESVRVPIPQRPVRPGVVITLRASPTFVPGPDDPRALGVMLDWLVLAPEGIALPPPSAVGRVAAASAVVGAAIALLGVTAGSAIGSAILLSAGLAALVARGFGPYTDYSDVTFRTGGWIAVATGLLTFGAWRLRGRPFRNTAKFAIVFSAAAMLLKLLVLLHPDMPVGDALFHAHRFQEVLAGRLYFTSLAPGNYQFPYAPGLYAVSMAFSDLASRGTSDMTLLRTVVCAADTLAGLLLYSVAVRLRGDRLAGALAVALYHLIPLGFGVITTGNLTNAFAQSLAVAALAIMAAPWLRLERRSAVVLLAVTFTAVFLSHTSAFAIVSVCAVVVGASFWWRGGPALRSPAAAVITALAVASVVAVAGYYAHFIDTYRSELARIGAETAAAAPDAGGRGIAERLFAVPRYLSLYFGLPALALAAWGAALLWQRGARDRVTLAAIGWTVSCGLFLLVGILTPVDMRYYLAALPIVALMAAAGASIAWASRGRPRVVAAILLGWAVVVGVRAWWSVIG
jgi:hypothetical protein